VSTAEAEIVAGGGSVEVGRGVRVAIAAVVGWVPVCAGPVVEGWDRVSSSGRAPPGAAGEVQPAASAASSASAMERRRLLEVPSLLRPIDQGIVNEPMTSPNGNGVRVPSRSRR